VAICRANGASICPADYHDKFPQHTYNATWNHLRFTQSNERIYGFKVSSLGMESYQFITLFVKLGTTETSTRYI
jgi:hypothetical protein